MVIQRFVRMVGMGVLVSLAAGCSKKADAEIDKKIEKMGEDLGNKLIVDMTRKQLADAKTKFAGGEAVDDECRDLRKDKTDVAKDKSADAVSLLKEIDVFCQLDVGLARDVASVKNDYDKMLDARKKKDRSFEQLHWVGLVHSCETVKHHIDELKQDKLESEAKAKEYQSQAEQMCTPENLARKKYFN